MSIYAFYLEGWEETSTWGEDQDYLYAQINHNGHDDCHGPEHWITPPDYPVVRTVDELAGLIAGVTAAARREVLRAMSIGATLAGATPPDFHRLHLPDEPAQVQAE